MVLSVGVNNQQHGADLGFDLSAAEDLAAFP
jgi:hypothetical protein